MKPPACRVGKRGSTDGARDSSVCSSQRLIGGAVLNAGSILQDMRIKRLPAGSIIPAQPVVASRPPSGANWVHEIKHDGYRLIVHRDGAAVRLYTPKGNNLTARLSAIAVAAGRIKAKSFTIDDEAVVA